MSSSDQSTASLTPLKVFVFVAFVGWGKNTVTELIEGMEGQDREAVLGDGAALHMTVMESDVIGGKKFWGEVEKKIAQDPSMSHLILNKNLPPGAWDGALKRLRDVCAKSNRSLNLYAIVPHSVGTERNPFTLMDLAVSVYSVLQRKDHPNLSASSPKVVDVATLFYRLYNDGSKGGREAFLKRVRSQLTSKVVCVEWLRGPPWATRGAAAQTEGLMRKVLSKLRKGAPEVTVLDVENEVRAFMGR